MVAQPDGVVTLLFSDVEGSTRLLERLGTERYGQVLELHRRLMREAFARFGGFEVGTEGDSFFIAFAGADDAVSAAREGQLALASAQWPEGVELRVRMGVHTGQPVAGDGNYVGMDVHRAARIMAAGHGGQVLVSEPTRALLNGCGLRDLGPQRLKDLLEPIRLYQLEIEGLPDVFPPLRSLHRSNLPVAAWPLLGRERELAQIRASIADGVRLVTLTGPGGSGKTRLALQAGGELSDEFVDGVFFVGLAPLRDPGAVRSTVAEALGLAADDDVAGWLESRGVLLVLDNLEHLPGVDVVVAELLVGQTVLLCTSRGPLRLSAEQELPVDPLPDAAAVELFINRAAAAGRTIEADETVAAVCRRLDNLPLAIELAAARTRLLSPSALLPRLDAALPLLTGGAGDRPERQRTLRATIRWSYELLDPDAQAAFRRLSVFRGSFTLDAAEVVTGAQLDHLAALVDQSLLKPLGDERLFMLETLREFAREQLDETGETAEYGHRHARHYLAQLEKNGTVDNAPNMGRALSWFRAEEDNLRAMLDRLRAMPSEAARGCRLLYSYWWSCGTYAEARERLRQVLAGNVVSDEVQAELWTRLAKFEIELGDLEAAHIAGDRAVAAAEAVGGRDLIATALCQSAWVYMRRGRTDDALRLARRAATVAEDLERRTTMLHDLGALLGEAGLGDEARRVFEQTMELAPRVNDPFLAPSVLIQIGFIDLYEHQFSDAQIRFAEGIEQNRKIGHHGADVLGRWGLGYAQLGLGQRADAHATLSEAIQRVLAVPRPIPMYLLLIASGIAHSAEPEDARAAARLRGAIIGLREREKHEDDPRNVETERFFDQPLIAALGAPKWNAEIAAAATMTLDETVQLAKTLGNAPSPPTPP